MNELGTKEKSKRKKPNVERRKEPSVKRQRKYVGICEENGIIHM
jgi:hypothetical protein